MKKSGKARGSSNVGGSHRKGCEPFVINLQRHINQEYTLIDAGQERGNYF